MTRAEQRLIGAAQAGDKLAFDTLYQHYASRVFAFALQLSGNRTDAEDLMQEAFVAAFQSLPRFRSQSTLLSWLLGIVVRRRRDQQRRPTPPPLAIPDRTERFDEQTVTGITLAEAVSALSEPQREAFLLVAAQGLTHREAAEAIGEPLGTIKWRVAEASRRLRAILQQDEERKRPGCAVTIPTKI